MRETAEVRGEERVDKSCQEMGEERGRDEEGGDRGGWCGW